MKHQNLTKQALKNKLARDYFSAYDCKQIIECLDFCVAPIGQNNQTQSPFFWAKVKEDPSDLLQTLVQVLLNLGKARTFDKQLPPSFIGAFDAEKIAFIPYNEICEVFYLNDFNWKVKPSNTQTREFKRLELKLAKRLEEPALWFDFAKDQTQLRTFIEDNFVLNPPNPNKTIIDKNNFIFVYNQWLTEVKPSIALNCKMAKTTKIIDGDFYLADLLAEQTQTLKQKLYALIKLRYSSLTSDMELLEFFTYQKINFLDQQTAHKKFWNKYQRPSQQVFWNHIIERRNLLVYQDSRKRKGSFFTPQIWVELAQKYLTETLGANWQQEYYVWDAAAGTANLLNGLSNPYHLWASTLDKQDVEVIQDHILKGANLLSQHVFQFDFLNDPFLPKSKGGKLPDNLYEILSDEKKREKLLLYINPPYAEASDKKTLTKGLEAKTGVEQSEVNKKYAKLLGQANAEVFAQFFMRIYQEIPRAWLAQFSTLKLIQGRHFETFRQHFQAKLRRLFLVPADSFDNVKGQFPIGFFIWETKEKQAFKQIVADVYDKKGKKIGKKRIALPPPRGYINDWIKPYRGDIKQNHLIGKFPFKGNDFQNQNLIQIVHHNMNYNSQAGQFLINQKNILPASVYFAVRKAIPATWLNDRDQFLAPKPTWQTDEYFKTDCLTYALFNNQIRAEFGLNHWIPFSEAEVKAQTQFKSNFMSQWLRGKMNTEISQDLATKTKPEKQKPLVFSPQAKAVFQAGLLLWQYYHQQANVEVNAGLYDIRAYFQGKNQRGNMKNSSEDKTYTQLLNQLKQALKNLTQNLVPKIYEHGFLLE